jgi:glycerophosphoryl diester phosphodiesterase
VETRTDASREIFLKRPADARQLPFSCFSFDHLPPSVNIPHDFLIFGHRGARGHEPENTLLSIRRALELGANAIEIDVWFVDGELIVFHDAKLDRTTNGHGYLSRKSFAYLRSLDAGKGERIPTLREVFETVDRRAVIDIELKGRRTAGPVRALIAEFIDRNGWRYEDFIVSSFLRSELRAISEPRIPRALLVARPTRLHVLSARRLGACAVNPALRFVTRRFVEEAHRRGLRVFVYTVNASKDIARMREIGVDGIFTDFPERAVDRPS